MEKDQKLHTLVRLDIMIEQPQKIQPREKKKYTAYQSRHRGDNLNDMKSPGSLAWYILWSADTLSGGIKKYENRFNVNVKKI